MSANTASPLQSVLEQVEALPPEQQEALLDLLHRRSIERRRDELAQRVDQVTEAHARGQVRSGGVDELLNELAS